jgi:hypothetical protein
MSQARLLSHRWPFYSAAVRSLLVILFWGLTLVALEPQFGQNQALAYRFVVMGDSRSNDLDTFINKPVLGSANQSISTLDPAPDFLIFLGDNSVLGDVDLKGKDNFTYQDWYNFMRMPPTGLPATLPMYLVIGNHELYQLSLGNEVQSYTAQTGYQAFANFNELLSPDTFMPNVKSLPGYDNLAYSFTSADKKSLFVVLDGFYVPSAKDMPYVDAGPIDNTQLQYLNDTLATSQATTKFVITHNPVFTPNEPTYATARDQSLGLLWQIVDNNDVAAVMNGHVHGYSRVMVDSSFTSGPSNPNPGLFFRNSIPQVIAGTVGAPLTGTVSNEPSTIYAPASWNWRNAFNYSVVDVDNSGSGKVSINSYCSDGSSPWTLCDSYTSKSGATGSLIDVNAAALAKELQFIPGATASQARTTAVEPAKGPATGLLFDPSLPAANGLMLIQESGG